MVLLPSPEKFNTFNTFNTFAAFAPLSSLLSSAFRLLTLTILCHIVLCYDR